PVGEALLGRVIDGFGRPLDGRELPDVCWKDYDAMPPPAMVRHLSRFPVLSRCPTRRRTKNRLKCRIKRPDLRGYAPADYESLPR
ncbi:hypothetical protein MJM04_33290, partial [Salmonella enterica subsp. enterica serovar Cerro]|nr:hypothetical protein [Salmonella enterica subsp. enterica serovar Cerro]